jgi:hypothetical protein
MKIVYTFFLVIFPIVTFSQSIQLRGKVIDVDRKPVANVSIRITSFGEAITTGSGEFVISIPKSVQFVDVTLQEENLQILYPVDAKIPVPSDPNFVTTIIVSRNKNSNEKSLEESVNKYSELESLLKEIGSSNNELKIIFERYIELEAKRLEISESKLKEEFQRKEKRDEIIGEVSPVIQEYLLRLSNLKNYFEMYYESAFVSNPSVEYLNTAIRAYNPVFDTIYNNRSKWQNEIKTHWDPVLSENFSSSINYMIDEIHTPYILQLNDCIKTINDVRLKVESSTKSPEELKNEIRTKVTFIMQNLGIKIPILENRVNELLSRLQHSDL